MKNQNQSLKDEQVQVLLVLVGSVAVVFVRFWMFIILMIYLSDLDLKM